jgi:hypothetical protein
MGVMSPRFSNNPQAWAAHSSTARQATEIKARLIHVLQTYVGLALPPTFTPFHPKDAAWAPYRALPFEARALVEHYLDPELLTSPG